MKDTVLFDVDGTLAKIEHRRTFVECEKPDWKTFNSLMGDDTPNVPIVELYKTLWNSGKYDLILVSGRSEDYREITEQWLFWNSIPFSKLLLRPSKDFRPDVEIKKEFLDQLRRQNRNILFAVDDRKSVVNMWRANGVTCLQCDIGDF